MAEFTDPNQQMDGHNWIAVVLLFVAIFAAFHIVQSFRHKLAAPQQSISRSDTSIMAKPFSLALNWIHRNIVANWGWAILVLTLLVNIVLMPARVMAMRSQRKMQRIQPDISAIKERYQGIKLGDPRQKEMQQEILDLQRKEGVNMLGGMLPLLVQMPLLYGFYRMLHGAVELRHAPWLWLHDLAAPDPWHILPVFFVMTIFLLQLLAPSPAGPTSQRRIMAAVLAIFGIFMTWSAAAGLALYWAFGNVINSLQQMAMNRAERWREDRARVAPRT